MIPVSMTVNGKAVVGAGRSAHAAGAVPAREPAADRHACRLRHVAMRRLRRPCRRPGDQVLHRRWRSSCDGAEVTTIEGLAQGGKLHPMQQAFQDNHGLQCGFCTPGMIMTGDRHRQPQGLRPRRADDPRGARRQYLPLHRLPQHRQIRRAGRARDGGAGAAEGRRIGSIIAIRANRPDEARRRIGRTTRWSEIDNVRETFMSATGIGASVKRKEDIRFITGKGHYIDDINRPGQAHAYFCARRTPMRRSTASTSPRRASAPGVVAVFTGDDLAADKVGGLICGWMIHSKDGSPMKAGAHPALAQGKVRYVGDHVAVVIADTYAQARDAAEKIVVDYGVLPAVDRHRERRQAGAPQVHDVAPNNTVYNWHLGDKAATDAAFAAAAHVTKLDLVNNRLIPNAMEPRAAVGEYDSGTGRHRRSTRRARTRMSRGSCSRPSSASRPSTSCGSSRPMSAAASARRSSSTPRRRSASGRPRRSIGRSNGRRSAPRPSSPTRMAAITSRTPNSRSTPTARSLGLRVHTIANLGAYLSTFCVGGADLSLRDRCCRASTTFRRSMPRSTRSTPTPRRSTPIAAPGGRRRRSSSSASSRWPRARPDATPPNSAAQNFITTFPHQTPVILCL